MSVFDDPTNPTPPNPYIAGMQTPGARKQAFTTDKPAKAPSRPDVIGSAKWHSAAMEAHPENRFFSDAQHTHLTITNAVDTLEHLYTTPDPRQTPAAHAEAVTRHAEQAAKRIEERITTTIRRTAEAIKGQESAIRERLKITADTEHGMEIRAKLASMKDDDRRQAITKAAQEGDHHVMAAVLHGPSFLVGMSEDEKARAVDGYKRRHAPDAMAELDAMRRSADKLEAAHFEAVDHIRRHFINRDHDPDVERAKAVSERYQDAIRSL